MAYTATTTYEIESHPKTTRKAPGIRKSSSASGDYKRPQHGIVSYLPAFLVPFAELMRLDRPSGFWAFYWHYLIGLGFAINLSASSATVPNLSLLSIIGVAVYLYVWTTIFRGLTCTWNDVLDQDVDRQVARTRNRPIARGALGTTAGLIFTVAQGLLCAAILFHAPLAARTHAWIGAVWLFVYPLLKRVTNYPQVELGFGLAYPVFFVCALLGQDLMTPLWAARGDFQLVWSALQTMPHFRAIACLYLAGILWTIIFDTVYAHQDLLDDVRAGVHGLAVLLGRRGTKPALGALAIIQTACLIAVGYSEGYSLVYYVLCCGGAATSLATMLWRVQLDVGESCAWWFGPGSRAVGASVVAGLVGEYIVNHVSA